MRQKSPLPKQASAIYSLLLIKGPLTAEQIGRSLDIFPQAVYRNISHLKELGCVIQQRSYPALFAAQPAPNAVETFSLLQREWFLQTFSKIQDVGAKTDGDLSMSFVESRSTMFEKSLLDMQKVKKEMNLLISGDETPAEIMLENKRMIERGVVIRALVQKRNTSNEELLQNWKRIGMEVRVCDPVSARIIIYDRFIVYCMSYDPQNIYKSVGIRFEYAPLGQLMNTLFMERWRTAGRV